MTAGGDQWQHEDKDEEEGSASLDQVLRALGDPVRLTAVRALALAGRPLPCRALGLPVSKSTITHHLRVLSQAGIITRQRSSSMVLNRLSREDLERDFPGLIDLLLTRWPTPTPTPREGTILIEEINSRDSMSHIR
ncbi:ArsR/SmtB family transcription factor [Streptomyces sp. NPDC003032]